MRRRFFVGQFTGDRAVMEGEAAHHLGRVLRAQPGQLYELSDGERVWLGRIEEVERGRVEFALLEELPAYKPSLDVTLLLSVVKFDVFEWAIEKATELGVSTIVPLAAGRSDKGLLAAAGKRAERWNKVLVEASQQSRRLRVPVLKSVVNPEEAFALRTGDVLIILSERTGVCPLQKVLPQQQGQKITLAVGPEGGWTEEEFASARNGGFQEASLGRLILRAETAVIAALASLNYAFGGTEEASSTH